MCPETYWSLGWTFFCPHRAYIFLIYLSVGLMRSEFMASRQLLAFICEVSVNESLPHMDSAQPGVWDEPVLGADAADDRQPSELPQPCWGGIQLSWALVARAGKSVCKQIMACMCALLVCGWLSAARLFSMSVVKCADCNCQCGNCNFFSVV